MQPPTKLTWTQVSGYGLAEWAYNSQMIIDFSQGELQTRTTAASAAQIVLPDNKTFRLSVDQQQKILDLYQAMQVSECPSNQIIMDAGTNEIAIQYDNSGVDAVKIGLDLCSNGAQSRSTSGQQALTQYLLSL